MVFTVPDKLRELLKNPKYQKILFRASKITMEEMVASSNKKSKKKTRLKIGMIQVLQTYGADMDHNPHVHCIVTEGGFDGRYVKHPPIAESRIIAFDGKQVTFWYKDSETKQKKQ